MTQLMELLTGYRKFDSRREMAELFANHLHAQLEAEAVSIFSLIEASQSLELIYSTSLGSNDLEDNTFGARSPIYKIFESGEESVFYYESMLSEYPLIDLYFEQTDRLKCIAFSTVFDSQNNQIAIIRAINKIDDKKKLVNFDEQDLRYLKSISNIYGAALSAKHANKRMLSFLDSVTHELLAPMSGVKNSTKLLTGYLSNSNNSTSVKMERVKANLYDILEFSQLSISLVQNLTMFSRSGKMEKRELNPKYSFLYRDIISKAINNLRALIKSRKFSTTKIVTEKHYTIPPLKVDRKVMLQIFSNILHNAIKYADSGPEKFSIIIEHEITEKGNLNVLIHSCPKTGFS
jgi:signal transduction histidine kinase